MDEKVIDMCRFLFENIFKFQDISRKDYSFGLFLCLSGIWRSLTWNS